MKLLSLAISLLLLCSTSFIACLDNGVARVPPMGWSTWTAFGCDVDENLIRTSAAYMANSTLKAAGYEYILLDDCWQACTSRNPNNLKCQVQAPRDKQGRIQPDPARFPSGLLSLSTYVHSVGLKLGIYTAVSATTCQNYTASLNYEAIDVATFADDWQMDFIKHDTCNTDCGIHDGCMQASTQRMSDAIVAYTERTGRPVIYYIDSGNPTSPMKVFNPYLYHVTQVETILKVARNDAELATQWAPSRAHIFKSWFDIGDSWESTLSNAQSMIRTEYYQQCGAFNNPDMLTVGMGGQTMGQYRAQFYLWSLFSSPLILSNDIRTLADNSTYSQQVLALITAPEIIAVNQDTDCAQASRVSAEGSSEIWIKTLSDKVTFAAVFINKHDTETTNVTLHLTDYTDAWSQYAYADIMPANSAIDVERKTVTVRDLFAQRDIGTANNVITLTVAPLDTAMISFKFID